MSIALKGNETAFASIERVAERMSRGELSLIAVADRALERIGALNPRLNAFITVTRELAREQAAEVDQEIRANRRRGGLHGIPVAVKDFYDTSGIRTTAGFAQFAQRIPTKDAAMVTRLRDAGAVLVGKTNFRSRANFIARPAFDSSGRPIANDRGGAPDSVNGDLEVPCRRLREYRRHREAAGLGRCERHAGDAGAVGHARRG